MPPKKQKMRLDTLLLDKQFFPSREQARSAIMQGAILVNNIATAYKECRCCDLVPARIKRDGLPCCTRNA